MKRSAIWLSVPVLFCLAFSFASRPVAVAQDAREEKWEYQVFRLDPLDYEDKRDYQAILKQHGARAADAKFQERVLNYLGRDGWEFVQVEQRTKGLRYYYVKRRASR